MTEQNQAAAGEKKVQFALQRIYVKDVSFEAPGSPQSFSVEWKPETKVQFNSSAQRIADTVYEVVLTLNVESTNGDKVAYLVEVKQAGVFTVDGPDQAVESLLAAQCPAILFPYARELVTDMVARGTFPQLLLQPMNFDAIYVESKRRQQKRADVAAAEAAAKH